MAKKDQILLEQIYSNMVNELKEPSFVTNRPHPIQPREGDLNVNSLVRPPVDQKAQYEEAAKKILNKILEKNHDVNISVLNRDNFGNVNFDEYAEAINAMAKHMMQHKDNSELIQAHAKDIAMKLLPKIKQITNRFNYNPQKQVSNLSDMNNSNAKVAYAKPQFSESKQFNTLNYLGKV